MDKTENFTSEDLASIENGLADSQSENATSFAIRNFDVLTNDLISLLNLEAADDLKIHEKKGRYSSGNRVWYLNITDEFKKTTNHLDRKIQGRIFEAITWVCSNPLSVKGDTAKPLTGTLKGLWRYRIGDFRLVYRPNNNEKCIDLITFAGRGGVYD